MFKKLLWDSDGDFNPFGLIALIVAAAFILVIVLLVFPFAIINAGERGVVTRVGAFARTMEPGIHWVTPGIESVTRFDVRTQKEQAEASAASRDLQTVNATVAVNYNVDPNKVGDLYVRVGTEYKTRVIDPAVQEVVKASTAKYTAEELITKRAVVTDEIQTALKDRLGANDIQVSSVSIINFNFSESFNQAIEGKVTAQQNALAAQNKLAQVQFEADQRVAQAKGEAEAIKIQAQAINSQGGADYVQLQAIKAWDGHLPQQFVPGSAIPFLNLK